MVLIQSRDDNAFVWHDSVIPKCTTEVPLVVAVPAPGWHGRVFHFFVDLGFGLEGGREGLHKLQPQGLLFMQDSGSGVGAAVNFVGFGAREPWGDYDLRAVEEDVEAEVMTVLYVAGS